MRYGSLLIVLAVLFLVPSTGLFLVPSAAAADREVSVKGSDNFKIKVAASAAELKGPPVDGARLVRQEGIWSLLAKDGAALARVREVGEGRLELSGRSGSVEYLLTPNAEGYLISRATGELVNRIKVKDDKFNLYNDKAVRLLRGKAKEDGFGVKNERDEQLLKIKGVSSLREASFFALQIPAEFRVVLWAREFLN